MAFDPELLKQLTESFSTELNEHSQNIINSLLTLEKPNLAEDKKTKALEAIFRSAHNIKGTSRSIGIKDVGEIAHRLESLFSLIQKKKILITKNIINVSLEAVDKMRMAFDAFLENKPLPFNLLEILQLLENCQNTQTTQTSQTHQKHFKAHKPTHKESDSHEHDSIRVSIQKIDKVSSLLEEIQVNKIAMMDHYSELTQLANQTKQFYYLWKQMFFSIKNQLGKHFSENLEQQYHSSNDTLMEINKSTQTMHKNMRLRLNELSTLSHSLQEEVVLLRMIPFANLICAFPRYVRDLSQELNKKVELQVVGDEAKIDKAVLEGLKDPFIHLLRNAVDHGIESPEVRIKKGKSETGLIKIEIKEENGKMTFSMTDDGAGIDVRKVANIALKKQLVSKADLEQMSDQEILDFIFHPGFSTKEIITDVSGRGVGLDVVRSNVEDLKGDIKIETQLDKGTTITLTVPLTIASERGLLVETGGEHFVLPTTSVERTLLINNQQIIDIQGNQAILLEGRTIVLRALFDILNLENKSPFSQNKIPIVIVKRGNHIIGLLVNEIIGEREIVIKTLTKPLTKVSCISGGTLLESNQVIMVLEPADIISEALKQTKSSLISFDEVKQVKIEKPHILVVDDSITTRTLEKSVLESKNYQVTIAVNGKEAWDILQKQKFSLVITDVMMPIMDGFTLTQHVKKSDKLRDLPVIIVTSLGSEAEKKRGIEVGADAYIVKNEFESGALLEIVSQLV